MFNRNMGCIEIVILHQPARCTAEFNRNMGCIEIPIKYINIRRNEGLIETWDVLKCVVHTHL